MRIKVTILGCGPSQGIPILACECPVCTSTHPRNKRLRSSILIETETGKTILVDTTPDLREQLLRTKTKRIDAVIFTHIHSDHCHGVDDLRPFYFLQGSPIPAYIHGSHVGEFKARFAYMFGDSQYQGATLKLDLRDIPAAPFDVCGLSVEPICMPHGGEISVGMKIGRFAYATDFKAFTSEQVAKWRGKIDVMIASGLRYTEHPSHSSVPETLSLFNELQVKRGIVSHMTHEVDYPTGVAELPIGRELAYDGMTVDAEG